MPESNTAAAQWFTSSYSGNGGQCVEVAVLTGVVGVRDTKHHGHGPELWVSATAARTFLASLADSRLNA